MTIRSAIPSAVATLALSLALAACGSQATNTQSSAAGSATSAPATATTGSESGSAVSPFVGMPNPWHDVTSADEAGKGAFGEGFSVPQPLTIGGTTLDEAHFSYMEGIAEARYETNGIEAIIRKGKGVDAEDFAGVYEDFERFWTIDVDGVGVACSGHEDGQACLIEWSYDDTLFMLYVREGDESLGIISRDDVPALVGAIQ